MNASLKTRLGLAVLVAVVVAAGVVLARSRPIDVIAVQRVDAVPFEVFGLGTVEARVLSRVGFAVPGTLERVNADHGDRIEAGTPLAVLDSAAQAARVTKAQALLTQAEASRGRARAQVGRAEALLAQRAQTRKRQDALVGKGSVSVEASDDARTTEQVAAAELEVARQELLLAAAAVDDARAQLEIERVQLAQHTLLAPYDSLVVERLREPGAVLNPGEAMFTLIDPASVWALAYVDEARAGGLVPGLPARVHLRSLPQQTFTGEIARIGIESDRVSEERRVYIQCTRCPERFYLGEQVEVIITKRVANDVLLIPEIAVLGVSGADGWVWTVEGGRLHKRAVKVGDRTLDGRVEVLSGVEEGTLVVAEPTPALREDKRVRSRTRSAP
ncbi:MAG: efflux RND transporter periplasmic adaptor subunit [Thiogranum sp.]|nr:efflux RND transporter periplasmic adaptor subunit [Thiogranum sp.]